MDILKQLSDGFWEETFWLPPNVTWKDMQRDAETFIPSSGDMWIPLPIAVLLFGVRMIWERLIGLPIGRYHNLPEKTRRAQPNPVLEKAFKKSRYMPNKHDLKSLSKQTDWQERKIERWWRIRRSQDKPGELQRFAETSWRFVVYTSFFIGGLTILWDKPYLWDTKKCWYGLPRQHVSDAIWWYYMLEMGFYYSLILTLFMDMKRKDFHLQLVHHSATLGLMMFSWITNFVRVGSLVLLVHDVVDPFLEIARCFNYIKYNKVSDAIFIFFVLLWFSTRIAIYPLWILNTTMFESISILGFANCYFVFNTLLIALLILHITWSWMILRLVKEYIIDGKLTDIESDADMSSSSGDESGATDGRHNKNKQQENGVLGQQRQNGTAKRRH